ncbi:MAG: hypothetical protein VYE68_14565 [Acidobacteriota bacterium]|nr:hypothetical protein [Acidobacteriota bacterium]
MTPEARDQCTDGGVRHLHTEGDADGIAGIYPEDSHRFDVFGGQTRGRAEAWAMYVAEIDSRGAKHRNPLDAEMALDLDFILPLSPSTGLVDGLVPFRGRYRRFTVIARQEPDRWHLAADRVIRQLEGPRTPRRSRGPIPWRYHIDG